MPRKKFKTGIAFSDFVSQDSSMFSSGKKTSSSFLPSQILVFAPIFLLAGIFMILVLRLFYVQIVQGAYYKQLSDQNRTRTEVIPAPRGIIFDRNGNPLVRNVPVFEVRDGKKLTIIPKDKALKLMSENKEVIANVSREYLYGEDFAHVLGYTGQISGDELNSPEFQGYGIADFVGKMGLEAEYESVLHGVNGKELYEVDATGRKSRPLGSKDPIPGQNITTTLDLSIQKSVAAAMKGVKKGAVVVSDPRNGGILAIYSKPSFDSNIFTHSDSYTGTGNYGNRESVLSDTENQPLLDRAIGGAYPPGSTFKLVTAAAALSTGAIKPDTLFDDTGILKVGGSSFGNWYYLQYGRTEGNINVVTAIKRSNDIFFYHAADAAGVDTISKWAKKLGAGQKLGIDLPGEVPGTVPTKEWKKSQIGEPWYTGDTFNYGIGQGYLLTTPLQVNFWTSVFANDGTLYRPHLILGQVKKLADNVVDKKYVDLIRTGMNEACNTGGVAWPLFNFEVRNPHLPIDNLDYTLDASASALPVGTSSAALKKGPAVRIQLGCKTGTAQIGGKNTNPDAWITVFAPFNNPEIVVTVLVENGGEGSSVAGPIAKQILTDYFKNKQ